MTATSLALTLGDTAVRQLDGLFSLNDLHAAAGGEERHKPVFFLRTKAAQLLIAESANSPAGSSAVCAIHGGPGRGTYASPELAIAYASWMLAKLGLIDQRAVKVAQGAGQ